MLIFVSEIVKLPEIFSENLKYFQLSTLEDLDNVGHISD